LIMSSDRKFACVLRSCFAEGEFLPRPAHPYPKMSHSFASQRNVPASFDEAAEARELADFSVDRIR
jgi:hypothetical protein